MLLFYYEKNELRAFVDNDGAWFVAADVARLLGYRDSPNMLRRFSKNEIRWFKVQGRRGVHDARAVSARALIGLAFRSRSERSEGFYRWLLDEVLDVELRKDARERAREEGLGMV